MLDEMIRQLNVEHVADLPVRLAQVYQMQPQALDARLQQAVAAIHRLNARKQG